ncbi:MAG: N-acetylmuramoyl-L-alanine amidase, partial [Paracoccus sp. (in: a-proteobacteria)]
TVDDRKVIKQLPLNEVGYHAGSSANGSSIAIETCMNRDINQSAADSRLVKLVAALLYDFGWDVDKVFPHKHWTGKDCPVLLLDDWEELLSDISEHLDALRSGDRVSGRLSGREDEFEFSDGESEISVEDFDIDHDELGKIIGES